MVTRYQRAELLSLRRHNDVRISRDVRKNLFAFNLWLPLNARQQLIGSASVVQPLQPLATVSPDITTQIPVLLSQSNNHHKHGSETESRAVRRNRRRMAAAKRRPIAQVIKTTSLSAECSGGLDMPSLYVFNAAGLEKMHAIEHLAADLASYDVDIAVITETHFKTRHTDSVIAISGYTSFRRDRTGRRGGGVALYVRSTIKSAVWTYSADDRTYELEWVRVGNTFVGLSTIRRNRYTRRSRCSTT
jgi:hypothetical protein